MLCLWSCKRQKLLEKKKKNLTESITHYHFDPYKDCIHISIFLNFVSIILQIVKLMGEKKRFPPSTREMPELWGEII